MSIQDLSANPMPILCQYSPNLCANVLIHYQPIVNSMRILANLGSTRTDISHNLGTNRVPIRCQSSASNQCNANPGPIWESQSWNNPGPMRCQSCIPSSIRQSYANPLPIQFQSITNPISLNYRSPALMSILDQSANPPPIHEAHANLPIPCQSNANPMPIYYQSVNPTPILANLQPIHTDISHRPEGTSTIGDLPKCLGTPSFTAHSRYANPSPNPINCQCSVNSLPIQCQSANPLPIRQSSTFWPIQCQFLTNPPIQ